MRLHETLTKVVNVFPSMKLPAARLLIEYNVPFHRGIGLRVAELDPSSGKVSLTLPYRKRNCNGASTIHGGVILALAESVHGISVLSRLGRENYRMFTKTANLSYIKKGVTDLMARFEMAPGAFEQLTATLAQQQFAEITLESSVTDVAGAEIARLLATYHVSPSRRRARA